MLSKEICRRCYEHNHYIWQPSWFRKLRFPNHHDAEKYWNEEHAVSCPFPEKSDPPNWKPIAGKFDVSGNPPKHCIYFMEHMVVTGHYDPTKSIEEIPPMEVER